MRFLDYALGKDDRNWSKKALRLERWENLRPKLNDCLGVEGEEGSFEQRLNGFLGYLDKSRWSHLSDLPNAREEIVKAKESLVELMDFINRFYGQMRENGMYFVMEDFVNTKVKVNSWTGRNEYSYRQNVTVASFRMSEFSIVCLDDRGRGLYFSDPEVGSQRSGIFGDLVEKCRFECGGAFTGGER